MGSTKTNKNTALATNQKAISGVSKHFAKVKNVTLAGVSYTPGALKGLFQDEIDANNALDASRAQMSEQVDAAQAVRAKASAARKGLRAYILGNYGAKAVQVLEDFGISPPKAPGPKTAQARADAAKKGVATREAKRKAAKAAVAAAPSTAAGATAPAQSVQASAPAQTAAPAATDTPKQ
jgi:hypothetical protein